MTFTVAIVGYPMSASRPCSTGWSAAASRWSTIGRASPATAEGQARLGDLDFTVIDTAGLEESAPESLSGRMRAQTETAIGQADAIFFMIDARVGPTPADRAFAELARKSGKPTVLIANKMEGTAGESGRLDAYALGLGDPVAISRYNEGFRSVNLARGLARAHRELIAAAGEPQGPKPIRVAIVGRPNAGKSTLVNRLIGEERLLTAPEAGTTRDAIAVDLDWRGQKFRIHDTAGLRRRGRVDEKLEKLSVADALNAVRFAEVVVVLLDVENAFEEQDQRIADLVEQEGRAIVIAVNKWDLKVKTAGEIGKLREQAEEKLTQMKGVPLVAVSAMTGEGLDRLMQTIVDAHAVWNKRVSTSALNRWFEAATSAHPPPAVSGRRLRLNYITQAKTRPPSFVLFCTRADALPDAYKRYLLNSLRESFDLPGTPIRLTLREKANPFKGRAKRKH
jgi:GTP-binding protein